MGCPFPNDKQAPSIIVLFNKQMLSVSQEAGIFFAHFSRSTEITIIFIHSFPLVCNFGIVFPFHEI